MVGDAARFVPKDGVGVTADNSSVLLGERCPDILRLMRENTRHSWIILCLQTYRNGEK